MNISRQRLKAREQKGLAMVEFTIVLPVLLLLLLATAEIGRALYQYDTLTKSVRDGARYLSAKARSGSGAGLDPAAFTVARNRVLCGKPSCSGGDELLPGMSLADVSATAPDADNIVITAQYLYQPMLGPVLPTFGLGSDISLEFTLSATNVMRIL